MAKRPFDYRHLSKSPIIGLILCAMGLALLLYVVLKDDPSDNTPAVSPETITTPTPDGDTSDIDTILQNVPQDRLSAVHGVDIKDQLIALPSEYTHKDEWVHQDVYQPLLDLIVAAQADGIRLSVVSAYRSYDHQKRIWERKWGDSSDDDTQKAHDILKYSSFPGTSRHHWGTDVDFNSVELSYWQSPQGEEVHAWLAQHAPKYGFCQTYGDGRTKGYHDEAWHWSHMPTAKPYYAQITEPKILAIALAQDVRGSLAVEALSDEIWDYITGISPCSVAQKTAKNQNLIEPSIEHSHNQSSLDGY